MINKLTAPVDQGRRYSYRASELLRLSGNPAALRPLRRVPLAFSARVTSEREHFSALNRQNALVGLRHLGGIGVPPISARRTFSIAVAGVKGGKEGR